MISEGKTTHQTNAESDRHLSIIRRVQRGLGIKFFLERQGLALCAGAALGGFLANNLDVFVTGLVAIGACLAGRFAVDMYLVRIGLRAPQVSVLTQCVDPDEEGED